MPGERIILLGVNHKTTPVEVREKMALSDGYEQPLVALKQIGTIRECYLLSTCNRVELVLVAEPSEQLIDNILSFLFGDRIAKEQCREYLYIYYDRDAVHHLFMVAASLDSMIVGEAQILGQLKEAYRHASRLGYTGPLLNRLLHKSFSVAKRVRTETAIGSAAVSISYAAVQLAKKIFGNIRDKKVLLIGAGEMAELAAEHLVGQGVAEVVVANRTLARGVELAKRFHGRAVSFDELISQLEQVDIIISSTGAPTMVLRQSDVRPVMRVRRNRPLFFIDIAVPRDLDPDLNDLENVYLYDIDDLSSVVEMNRSGREREAVKATRIIDEMTLGFGRWMEGMTVTPTILALRRKADGICRAELEKTLPRLTGLSEEEKHSIEVMLSAVTAKMLHAPLTYLKSESCGGRDNSEAKIDTVRTIFDLGDDDQ